MIYTELTKKALKLCFAAHKEQVDKSGMPYVFHPFHLAEQMTDEATTITALLHDVVEDTDYTLADLLAMGFPMESLEAIRLMTHDKSVPYLQYVTKLRENPVAAQVKLADLQHNSDLSRLDTVTPEDRRRALKYRMAMAILQEPQFDDPNWEYRISFPLDWERLCYLEVFYTLKGVRRYSLDIEEARDIHIDFDASELQRVMALLPAAESLPEAMALYLETNSPGSFVWLLKGNDIPYQSFSY